MTHRRAPLWLTLLLTAGIVGVCAWFGLRVWSAATPEKLPADFGIFHRAAQAVVNGENIYEVRRPGFGAAYIYPPLLAVLLTPLAGLRDTAAYLVWGGVNGLLLALLLWLSFDTLAPRLRLRKDPTLLLAAALLALLANADQIRWEFELGQTDILVCLGFVLGLRWMDRRPVAAGLALGFAFCIKYVSIIALPYFIIRGRFAAAAATAIGCAAWLAAPAMVLGWQTNLSYLPVAFGGITGLFGVQLAGTRADVWSLDYHRSVSLVSASQRLIDGMGWPPGALVAVVGGAAAAVFAAAWWVYRLFGVPMFRHRSPALDGTPMSLAGGGAPAPVRAAVVMEWMGLIVATLAFSPQTIARHSFILLPAHLVLAMIAVSARRLPTALLAGGALLVSLLGTTMPPGSLAGKEAVDAWRSVGGASWCWIAMFLLMLAAGFRFLREGPRRDLLAGPA
ncbi:MAG: DUF2029 domain-containing protein [Phycisphaerales bacterium]|nr:DUF2029 domain-containing protein [Phycisphaerales bacterium]